jgi:hypothetical protein
MKLIAASLVLLSLIQASSSPQSAVDELLGADRRFAADAAKTTAIPALSAMLAEDVAMPIPGPPPGFARGKSQAVEALKKNPDNTQGRLEWTPVRGGVAADGQHGFTVGYLTLTKPDATKVPIKYVAYWTKKPEGWRVAVYKRVTSEQPPASREMMPPALTRQLVAPTTDPSAIARYKASLEAAERAFSDDAQKIGLGPAFAKHGSADAVNVGPRTSATFVLGAAEIGKSMGPGTTSPVSWAADEGAIVASSGDLGVNFGYIRQNGPPPAGGPGAVPFITIWRRASVNDPWRYVAE